MRCVPRESSEIQRGLQGGCEGFDDRVVDADAEVLLHDPRRDLTKLAGSICGTGINKEISAPLRRSLILDDVCHVCYIFVAFLTRHDGGGFQHLEGRLSRLSR